MIKHLLIAITLLAGCDGYHWFYACDDPNKPPGTVYCTTSGDDGDYPCEGGKLYYVWLLSDICGEVPESFCAADDADAQAKVDELYGDTTHGAPSLDQHATEPHPVTRCGSNPDHPELCNLGSSDESLGTGFYVFTDDQIPTCEMQLDSDCTSWAELDPQTGKCPGAS